MDSIELSTFRWMVPKSGFEWKKERKTGALWLYEAPDSSGLIPQFETDPARKTPLLHRDFARLWDRGPDEMLLFSTAHGNLGTEEVVEMDGIEGEVIGESLESWKEGSYVIAIYTRMLEATRQGTLQALNQSIEQLRKVQGGAGLQDGVVTKRFGHVPPREFKRKAAAADYLRKMVAHHVAFHLSSNVYMIPADRKDTIEFRAQPINLWGFMWAALAVEFEGLGESRKCPTCGQEFFIATGLGVRGHRVFCSNTCKSTLYQRRRKEAMVLAASGKTAKQIAKKLSVPGSSVSSDTVQRWIAKS